MPRIFLVTIASICLFFCAFSITHAQTATPTATAVTVLRDANLRAGPGTTYSIVGSAKAGDTLLVVDENDAGDWYQLDTGAWIAAFLVADSANAPVKLATPTATPRRSGTPIPPTPTATPQIEGSFPYTYTGTGDSIVDISAYADAPALLLIKGNTASRFFAVQSFDENDSTLDLLVNTTEPYLGLVPLNFGSRTAGYLEINAVGPWLVTAIDLLSAERIHKGVELEGTGDYVLIAADADIKTAAITGNDQGRFFAVQAAESSGNMRLLVNTTDPYVGTVRLRAGTLIFIVHAVGDWSITVN